MADQHGDLKRDLLLDNCECGIKDNASPSLRRTRAKTVTLSVLTVVSLLLLGGIFYLNTSGIGTKPGSSALCQPCQASRECGFLEQSLAPTGLSALIFGSTRSVQFDMECRANVCVPIIIPKHESICQPTAQTVNPVEIEIFEGIEGRSDSSFVSRRLQMARGVVRTVKKQRRLQRIRNDKFTEYFQSRALGSDRGGGHGYLGINYSHDKDE